MGGTSDDARKIIHEAQPYMWGDAYFAHPLFILGKLWNIDLHCHALIGSLSGKQTVSQPNMPEFSFHFKTMSFDKFGARVTAVPNDSPIKVNLETTIELLIFEFVEMTVLEFSDQAYCIVKKILLDCVRECL